MYFGRKSNLIKVCKPIVLGDVVIYHNVKYKRRVLSPYIVYMAYTDKAVVWWAILNRDAMST